MNPHQAPDVIKYNGPKPVRSYPGDAGWDLVSSAEVSVRPGETVDVPTGLFIALPLGFWAHLVSRSSTTKRHGIIVLDGIIDNGYRGEMFAQVYNPVPPSAIGPGWIKENTRVIPKGTRVAQLILHKIYDVLWVEQAILPESKRGSNGFGSSGR